MKGGLRVIVAYFKVLLQCLHERTEGNGETQAGVPTPTGNEPGQLQTSMQHRELVSNRLRSNVRILRHVGMWHRVVWYSHSTVQPWSS
jgi:hypothetical protein